MLFFTVCHINQLPEAHVLGDSILSYHPNADFRIGLIDKKDRIPRNFKVRYPVLEVSALKIIHFEEMANQYIWNELSANCKPFYAKYFLEQSDKVVYFDCTSRLHNPIDFIQENLKSYTIIIVPQLLLAGVHPDEKQILNTGIFHSGFLALKKSEETFSFLDWWGNNTAKKGYIDLCKGMNADQLWLEHVPNFYDGVLIHKHEGLNIGIWNLPERQIDKARNTSNSQPIISFNFKGMKYPVAYKKEISKYPIKAIIPFFGLPNPKKETIGKAIATNIRKLNTIIDKIIDLI